MNLHSNSKSCVFAAFLGYMATCMKVWRPLSFIMGCSHSAAEPTQVVYTALGFHGADGKAQAKDCKIWIVSRHDGPIDGSRSLRTDLKMHMVAVKAAFDELLGNALARDVVPELKSVQVAVQRLVDHATGMGDAMLHATASGATPARNSEIAQECLNERNIHKT